MNQQERPSATAIAIPVTSRWKGDSARHKSGPQRRAACRACAPRWERGSANCWSSIVHSLEIRRRAGFIRELPTFLAIDMDPEGPRAVASTPLPLFGQGMAHRADRGLIEWRWMKPIWTGNTRKIITVAHSSALKCWDCQLLLRVAE